MELFKNNRIAWVISAILAIIILLMSKCSAERNYKSADLQGADVKIILTKQKQTKYLQSKPMVIYQKLPADTMVQYIYYKDTAAAQEMIRDYLTDKYYADTIEDDTCRINYTAVVSHGKLDSLQVGYLVKIPWSTAIITPAVKTPWKFYVGGNIGTNGLGIVGGPELMLTDRKFMMYKAGVDFSTFTTPVYRIGIGVKLSIKKK